MNWLFEDDICWCYNSSDAAVGVEPCRNKRCFRHLANRVKDSERDIFTIAIFKGTKDCPYFNKEEEE